MGAINRNEPYIRQFWANTQKQTLSAMHQRYLIGGMVLGDDMELCIFRHRLNALGTPFQTAETVAANTGLNIIIDDTRDVVALKLTDSGGGAGDIIQQVTVAADGTKTVGARLTSGGMFTNSSAGELKSFMTALTDKQLEKIIRGAKIHRFTYDLEPNAVYLSPEAGEFHALTKMGDDRTIAPSTIASLALKGVQWLFKKLMGIEERLQALEAKMMVTEEPAEDAKTA